VAVDRASVELEAANGDRRSSLVVSSLKRLSFALSGVQLGITVCSVSLGFIAEPAVASALATPLAALVGEKRSGSVSIVLALAIATAVQMVVGELIPKAIAVGRPLGTAKFLAPVLRIYSAAFRPVIVVFGSAADRIVRLLGIEPAEELLQVRSRGELQRLVTTSGAEGTLEPDEVELLTKTFRFGEKSVAEILTPRIDMVTIGADATTADLRSLMADSGHSRFPVEGVDADDIIGVVHVKSLFDLSAESRANSPISPLITEVTAVPESRRLDDLLLEMREQRLYLVVVIDEYGGTAGIVTLEDLLEEIVGEIDDEHDGRRTRRAVARWGGSFVLNGGMNRDEVLDGCGFAVPEGEFETLAGFVLEQLGRIPEEGDAFEFDDWLFEVFEMDERRVSAVRVVAPEVGEESSP
jgi:CBS domain containing-hemolysin-like protein